MGKGDRLHNRVDLFAALFWALVIVHTCQHLTLPAGPASLHRCTQSMSLFGYSWFNSQRRRIAPPPFSYLGMLFIYEG